MDKYYIVTLSTGDCDGVSYKDIFITNKEYKAKWYCSKGNAILAKYASYYEDLLESIDNLDTHKRGPDYINISDKRNLSMGTFMYSEIPFRSDIKVISPH